MFTVPSPGDDVLRDPSPPRAGAALIPQERVAEYLTLEASHRRFEQLKEELKRALAEGAVVEPGDLHLELDVREQRALTAEYLVAALGLGQEQVDRLRADAPVRRLRYLRAWYVPGAGSPSPTPAPEDGW
jgi:hypothetical protein